MPGPSPGGSPERGAGAGDQPQGPGRDRRVQFLLPHITIPLPSVRDEEQLFYRRLEALVTLGPGSFGPLFAADGWSDLTGKRCGAPAPGCSLGHCGPRVGAQVPSIPLAADRLLRKRLVQDGQGGPRPGPGQEVSVKVLGALEDGGLVDRDPRLSFVPGHGDVVQVSPGGSAEAERYRYKPGQPCRAYIRRLWSWASPPCGLGRSPSSSPPFPTATASRAGRTGGQGDEWTEGAEGQGPGQEELEAVAGRGAGG